MNQPPDVSICMVAYNARDYLRLCLETICSTPLQAAFEIILVDNHSTDGTLAMLAQHFPHVRVLTNSSNQGFSKPANRAVRESRGRCILLLNPDAVVIENAIDILLHYLDAHPQTGIVGPKILNHSGTLQKQCRRSEGRPWDAFCYLSGLSRLFPHNPRLSGYLLSYLDEETTNQVQAVSGACMLVRRQVFDQVGLLDERFFAYQEDSDLCRRARLASWQVVYLPAARITHYGGKGGAGVEPYRSIFEWHRSYYRYYRKHFAPSNFFLLNWLIYLLIALKTILSLLINLFRREKVIGSRKS